MMEEKIRTIKLDSLRRRALDDPELRLAIADARAAGFAEIPTIRNIDAQILEKLGEEHACLDMGGWHHGDPCGTTHCRGGWAIFLAGKEGQKMEQRLSTATVARLIYAASRPGRDLPSFYMNTSDALDDLIEDASDLSR